MKFLKPRSMMALATALFVAAVAYAVTTGRPVMAQTTITFPSSCSFPTQFEFGGVTITKTNLGVSVFSFSFTVNDPMGTRIETFPPATLNFGESASPFFAGDDDDDIIDLTISVNNGGTFSTSNFQNFCSDEQGGGPFGGLSVSYPLVCPLTNNKPATPFEVAMVDLTNAGPIDLTFDYEWRIGTEYHRDTATLTPGQIDTFRACDLMGNASADVVTFRVVDVQAPGNPTNLQIVPNSVINQCQTVPCDNPGSVAGCNMLRKTFPASRESGKQEAVSTSLIRHSSAGTITVNAQWNATALAMGTPVPVVVQACTAGSPIQCGNITITKKVTKLQRFEYPPFPDCLTGTLGGIDSLCVSNVDAPPGSLSASFSRYTRRDTCQ